MEITDTVFESANRRTVTRKQLPRPWFWCDMTGALLASLFRSLPDWNWRSRQSMRKGWKTPAQLTSWMLKSPPLASACTSHGGIDLYIPALLEGFLGLKRWMAAQIGKIGGRASTEAKPRLPVRTES